MQSVRVAGREARCVRQGDGRCLHADGAQDGERCRGPKQQAAPGHLDHRVRRALDLAPILLRRAFAGRCCVSVAPRARGRVARARARPFGVLLCWSSCHSCRCRQGQFSTLCRGASSLLTISSSPVFISRCAPGFCGAFPRSRPYADARPPPSTPLAAAGVLENVGRTLTRRSPHAAAPCGAPSRPLVILP
jgi:hypothetical protein